MRLEIKKYLYDIQYAIGLLREFTGDKTFADYGQKESSEITTLSPNNIRRLRIWPEFVYS